MSKYSKITLKTLNLDKYGNYNLADQIDQALIKLAFEYKKPTEIINEYYDQIGKYKIQEGYGRNTLRSSFISWCKKNDFNYDDMTKRPVLKYLFEDQEWFKNLPAFTNKDRGFIPKPPKQQKPWTTIKADTVEERKENFIKTFLPTAKLISQQTNYKIPTSVILGIMAFESGWTTSKKSKSGNVFGLTGTDEEFKTKTIYDVMSQLPLFLTGKKRYHDAKIFELGTKYKQQLIQNKNLTQEQREELIEKYIQRLKDAGYNSEPIPYVQQVMDIVRQNNFTR